MIFAGEQLWLTLWMMCTGINGGNTYILTYIRRSHQTGILGREKGKGNQSRNRSE